MASYSEVRKIARKADRAEDEEKERLARELTEKLPEMDALEGVRSGALIAVLRISRKMRSEK